MKEYKIYKGSKFETVGVEGTYFVFEVLEMIASSNMVKIKSNNSEGDHWISMSSFVDMLRIGDCEQIA